MMTLRFDTETLAAMDASIEHWRRLATSKVPGMKARERPYAGECALCGLFLNPPARFGCVGCPVEAETGERHCNGTPYGDALYAWAKWSSDPGNQERRAAWETAAYAELAFLESVRAKCEPSDGCSS